MLTRLALILTFAAAAVATPEIRLALVIGNAAYDDAPLVNPLNDARELAAALESVGFRTTRLENADQRAMKQAIDAFGEELRGGGVGLFYFSGHGIQVRGRNYLVPIGARMRGEPDVEYECVDAGRVLAKVADARASVNLVILDACRNNPFTRSFRSASKGLAMMDAPSGTLIAYATAPGDVASDNPGGTTGLYTTHLLRHIRRPRLKVEEVMKAVRADVARESANGQIPWESSSLIGDFYFVPGGDAPPADGEAGRTDRPTRERPSFQGMWVGTWQNERSQSSSGEQAPVERGATSVTITRDEGGVIEGSWDYIAIQSGRRIGETEARWSGNDRNGRSYDVHAELLDQARTLRMKYDVSDSQRQPSRYSGRCDLKLGSREARAPRLLGTWVGTWTNRRLRPQESGATQIVITEDDGATFAGRWDYINIAGGTWTSPSTWHWRGDDGNGRQYDVTGTLADGGASLRLEYTVRDNLRQPSNYSGSADLTRR